MKVCEKYEVEMLKIILIIIDYTLNNFSTQYHNIIVEDENNNNFKT